MPRRLRYSRASAPAMPCSCSAYHLATSRHDVGQGRRRARPVPGARGSGAGTSMPGLGGKLLDRVHELHAAIVGEEADRVAMRAAAEAMVEALVVVDREAGRLFIVERAAGLPLASGADQLHRRRDHAPKAPFEREVRRGRRAKGSSESRVCCTRRRPQARAAELSTGGEADRRLGEYLAKPRKCLISSNSFHARNERN